MYRYSLLALALAIWQLAGLAAAKELGRFPAADGSFEVALATEPEDAPLVLNRVQTLVVRVIPRDPLQAAPFTGLAFDARMPAHDHGMVTKPKVTTLTPGEFRVEGVKLHMAGAWELSFLLSVGEKSVKVTAPYAL